MSKSSSATQASAAPTTSEQEGQGNLTFGSKSTKNTINVTSSDPEVSEAAITAAASVSEYALQQQNVNTALAFSTIDNLTAASVLSNEESSQAITAQNLNAANGFGVTPQGFSPSTFTAQDSGAMPLPGSGSGSGLTLNNVALWVTVLGGLAALYYYAGGKKIKLV